MSPHRQDNYRQRQRRSNIEGAPDFLCLFAFVDGVVLRCGFGRGHGGIARICRCFGKGLDRYRALGMGYHRRVVRKVHTDLGHTGHGPQGLVDPRGTASAGHTAYRQCLYFVPRHFKHPNRKGCPLYRPSGDALNRGR